MIPADIVTLPGEMADGSQASERHRIHEYHDHRGEITARPARAAGGRAQAAEARGGPAGYQPGRAGPADRRGASQAKGGWEMIYSTGSGSGRMQYLYHGVP